MRTWLDSAFFPAFFVTTRFKLNIRSGRSHTNVTNCRWQCIGVSLALLVHAGVMQTPVAPQRANRPAAAILLLPAYADNSRGQILGNSGRSLKTDTKLTVTPLSSCRCTPPAAPLYLEAVARIRPEAFHSRELKLRISAMYQTWDNTMRMPVMLASIAETVGVPVIVICKNGVDGTWDHASYGLDDGVGCDALALALHKQSAKCATVIPNLAVHPELSVWAGGLVARDIRFMVGLPLHGDKGDLAGSVSVIASQKAVAGTGVPIALLRLLGKQFIAHNW